MGSWKMKGEGGERRNDYCLQIRFPYQAQVHTKVVAGTVQRQLV